MKDAILNLAVIVAALSAIVVSAAGEFSDAAKQHAAEVAQATATAASKVAVMEKTVVVGSRASAQDVMLADNR